jgi:cell fate (sporulation/competence/biofilm development) regulator YmcA (YheA/YmcA/DUF963 family)
MEKTEKLITRKEIMEQTEKLAMMIAQSEEVEFFKKAEQQIKKNDKVQKLINAIKFKQKQAVHSEHYDKDKSLGQIEGSLEKLHQELDDIPVVLEFKQSQLEVNELLQLITSMISNTVTDQIIISTGGDPLSGETGGSAPSCQIK